MNLLNNVIVVFKRSVLKLVFIISKIREIKNYLGTEGKYLLFKEKVLTQKLPA